MILKNLKENELPILSLRISEEIIQKFNVPISMAKSIGFIMTFYLFGLLNLRVWLLIILLYFFAGFLWLVTYVIPPEVKTSEEREFSEDKTPWKQNKTVGKITGEGLSDENRWDSEPIELKEIVPLDKDMNISPVKATSLSASAFNAGRKVREKVQRPVYTLNHILSTLTAEDFSIGYRVPVDELTFPSIDGQWSPKKGLIIFPINLEQYDYRREGQTLLLTFHQPRNSKDKITMNFGGDKSTIISKDQVKFGEVIFNPRTLIVLTDDFENVIKPQLETIDENEDISYTGFQNLLQMQEILSKMADKWIEIRYKAKEVSVNFLAGLLGAKDPIFIPIENQKDTRRLKNPKSKTMMSK